MFPGGYAYMAHICRLACNVPDTPSCMFCDRQWSSTSVHWGQYCGAGTGATFSPDCSCPAPQGVDGKCSDSREQAWAHHPSSILDHSLRDWGEETGSGQRYKKHHTHTRTHTKKSKQVSFYDSLLLFQTSRIQCLHTIPFPNKGEIRFQTTTPLRKQIILHYNFTIRELNSCMRHTEKFVKNKWLWNAATFQCQNLLIFKGIYKDGSKKAKWRPATNHNLPRVARCTGIKLTCLSFCRWLDNKHTTAVWFLLLVLIAFIPSPPSSYSPCLQQPNEGRSVQRRDWHRHLQVKICLGVMRLRLLQYSFCSHHNAEQMYWWNRREDPLLTQHELGQSSLFFNKRRPSTQLDLYYR